MELDFLLYLQTLRNPILDQFFVFITRLGDVGWFFIVLGIILLFRKKTRKVGLHILLALLFSSILCNLVLKNLVARERPSWIVPEIELLIANPKDYSFPSGHTSASIATAIAIFLYNKKYGIYAFLLAGAIAFSRMYLFVHFPTDILGGIITGTLSSILACWLIFYYEKEKRKKHI